MVGVADGNPNHRVYFGDGLRIELCSPHGYLHRLFFNVLNNEQHCLLGLSFDFDLLVGIDATHHVVADFLPAFSGCAHYGRFSLVDLALGEAEPAQCTHTYHLGLLFVDQDDSVDRNVCVGERAFFVELLRVHAKLRGCYLVQVREELKLFLAFVFGGRLLALVMAVLLVVDVVVVSFFVVVPQPSRIAFAAW